MTNKTMTKPFDHVMWNVSVTSFDWNDGQTDWTDCGTPLWKYDLTFEYFQHALDYMRSWTMEAARSVIRESGRTGLEVAINKQFYLTTSEDSYDGRIPFVAGTMFWLDGDRIVCEKDYDDEAIHSNKW